ncbi:hypothetical protein MNBD_GAMMA12-1215 [hydrothermal vent metagenome]|uniref:Uncharacterized protein n=1 Tax=hydrothermal vent metagenome TaxID=652676 RepID=A0A3B0YS42_9ZZZZ
MGDTVWGSHWPLLARLKTMPKGLASKDCKRVSPVYIHSTGSNVAQLSQYKKYLSF